MKIYIGIDLHGTLLNKQEKITESFQKALYASLKKLKAKAKLFVCTGNDLPFVKEVIPQHIFSLFDGCVLETGCVVSDGAKEVVKVPAKIQDLSQKLRKKLENRFPETEFRRRLTTISLFCSNPKNFAKNVEDFVNKSRYIEDFDVTYSSVAVDVIPKGWDKFIGMKMIAGKNKIIGIADSMNDFGLLERSHFSFIPSNAPPEIINKLQENGKRVVNITKTGLDQELVIQANHPDVEGVIEILNFLSKRL